jgi:hypothetical protein
MAGINMNLRELFTLYPLGCESFGAQWLLLWEDLGRLLEKLARVEYFDEFGNDGWYPALHATPNVARALIWCIDEWKRHQNRCRIVLLDGTIIREWPANA